MYNSLHFNYFPKPIIIIIASYIRSYYNPISNNISINMQLKILKGSVLRFRLFSVRNSSCVRFNLCFGVVQNRTADAGITSKHSPNEFWFNIIIRYGYLTCSMQNVIRIYSAVCLERFLSYNITPTHYTASHFVCHDLTKTVRSRDKSKLPLPVW